MVGWDTPEPDAWGDDIRPIYLVGNRRRTKNPLALAMGSVNTKGFSCAMTFLSHLLKILNLTKQKKCRFRQSLKNMEKKNVIESALHFLEDEFEKKNRYTDGCSSKESKSDIQSARLHTKKIKLT